MSGPRVSIVNYTLSMMRGGGETRDMNFASHLRDLGCEVTLVSVDPLGADEPAPNAFTEAFNLLAPGGWVALHLSEESAAGEVDSRFARVVLHMIAGGAFEVETRERYRHRLTTGGEPIYHHALIGRKIRDFDPGEPQ